MLKQADTQCFVSISFLCIQLGYYSYVIAIAMPIVLYVFFILFMFCSYMQNYTVAIIIKLAI